MKEKLSNTLNLLLLATALASCSPRAKAQHAAVVATPVAAPSVVASASPPAAVSPVPIFDGRLLDGKTSLPGPSLADLPTVEEEVGKRAREPFLVGMLGGDTELTGDNFQVRMGLEGSFTRPGAKQKAFFYRLSLTNGLVITEDGKVVAHYVGSPGDYALYTNLAPVDVNLDGLTDLVMSRNVEDTEDIFAYLFLARPDGLEFSGETTVYDSNANAGEEPPAEGEAATAYSASVTPGPTPKFHRVTYQRKGAGQWVESSPLTDFNLAQPYARGDEPKWASLAGEKAEVDPATQTQIERVQSSLDRLDSYADVPSSIDFANPGNEGERLVAADEELRLMELLDTRAAVYAVENATKQEVDHTDSAKYALSLEGLDTPEKIRLAYMNRTNESLGGESPYTQGLTEGQP